MPSLFRRKSDELVAEPVTDDASTEVDNGRRPRGYTPGKGRPTPKRGQAQRRVVEPPPANKREAARRLRERQRTERAEAARGMRAGDERYLLRRDKGPEKALVRDIVDSRRNASSYFFAGVLVVLVGSVVRLPVVQMLANLLWLILLLVAVADGILISRRVRRLVRERYPNTKERMGSLYFYAVMRALSFRGMRVPNPRVKIGQQI
ncbi:MAG TPA: DUF3043 domain-containing protein [Micromonosporaceae bacterium]